MPIRINLLAEQQAAEEMRRRDPVKRAGWAAGVVIALVLLWSLDLQFKISAKRSQLAASETSWNQMASEFLQVSNNQRQTTTLLSHMNALQKYMTNRFLWATPLNALQYAYADRVRVMKIEGKQSFTSLKRALYTTTTAAVPRPAKSWWKFGAAAPGANIRDTIDAWLAKTTNNADLAPYGPELKIQVTYDTNRTQISANAQVTRPDTATEKITLTIAARDYGSPPASHIDQFYNAVMSAIDKQYYPSLKNVLNSTNCTVQPETIQPMEDSSDPINPRGRFIPFTVKGEFPDRIRSNE